MHVTIYNPNTKDKTNNQIVSTMLEGLTRVTDKNILVSLSRTPGQIKPADLVILCFNTSNLSKKQLNKIKRIATVFYEKEMAITYIGTDNTDLLELETELKKYGPIRETMFLKQTGILSKVGYYKLTQQDLTRANAFGEKIVNRTFGSSYKKEKGKEKIKGYAKHD